jgi:GNAT superfamily N-acetyltransferase
MTSLPATILEAAVTRDILAPMAVIRRAGMPDRDELMPLIREFYAVDRHEFDPDRVARGLDPLLADDTHGQVWLAGDGGYAVVTWGWSLESGGREALLDEIYVRDRGRGVGRELLSHAMAAAAKAGATRMFLETEAHNERVRAFYASLGFAHEDSTWMSADL